MSMVTAVDKGAVMLLLVAVHVSFLRRSSRVSLGRRKELRVAFSLENSLISSMRDPACHQVTIGRGLPGILDGCKDLPK